MTITIHTPGRETIPATAPDGADRDAIVAAVEAAVRAARPGTRYVRAQFTAAPMSRTGTVLINSEYAYWIIDR